MNVLVPGFTFKVPGFTSSWFNVHSLSSGIGCIPNCGDRRGERSRTVRHGERSRTVCSIRDPSALVMTYPLPAWPSRCFTSTFIILHWVPARPVRRVLNSLKGTGHKKKHRAFASNRFPGFSLTNPMLLFWVYRAITVLKSVLLQELFLFWALSLLQEILLFTETFLCSQCDTKIR